MSDAAASYQEILRQQHAFAVEREIELSPGGQAVDWRANLLLPPGRQALGELVDELPDASDDASRKPGSLHDLHSTRALACNFFEHWREREAAPLAAALGIRGDAITSLGFVPGDSAVELSDGVDVWLEHASGRPTAILTSYADAYADIAQRPGLAGAEPPGGWGRLHACRGLAAELRRNPRRFARLAAGRLIETAAVLTNKYGEHGFRLLYLWHEASGRAGRRKRREIDRLRMRVGGEIQLMDRSWRQAIESIQSAQAEHALYSAYLKDRYLRSRFNV